ncbi:pseudouridine synthase [Fibrella aquatilis]|uniref:Pseudouridine synthase n=1 Tax=Fibrella aquatilis TaxID=2817059 RepID=A0A939FZY4_9BACT|nr:pseudouridine synthase [Fibrella aquatilis]MBO0929419.1 pseudouridine synthase [Fibrella aquatilis]
MKRNSNSNDRRDGEGRSGGRRDDARPAYNRDDRSGSDRPRSNAPREGGYDKPRNGGPDGPRKPYKPYMGGSGNAPHKPFERKPYDGERKPYAGGDRTDGPRKPYAGGDRADGPRKPWGDKPRAAGPRSFDRDRDDRPRDGDRSTFERKPFNRDDRPRSFDRDAPRNDGPREPRSFDRDDRKPFERKPFDRNDGPRDAPRGERPARPFDRDSRDERPARSFDREVSPRNDRPRDNRDERPARPFSRSNDRPRNDGPRELRSFDRDAPREPRTAGPRSFDRDDRKPFDRDAPREPRPRTSGSYDRAPRRNDRDERPRTDENGERHIERRTGHYKTAPNYNMDRMKENLPQSRKVARNLQRESDPNAIRLNRYIANAGICSRREADELIAKGDVQVNGTVITEMGYRVKPGDVVKYGNKVLNPEKMVYLLLNKPKDYITTTEDPEARETVMDLIADAGPFRLYPVGRLDRNTTGLLLMTNDGELAGKLTHPSNNVKKVYQVEIDKPITDEHFEAIRAGVELEDGFIKPDDLAIVTPDAQVIGVEIHSGRNRIVRRMFEHFGYVVTKLDRTVFAGLTKKELPRGKWRFLEAKEVVKLKYLS